MSYQIEADPTDTPDQEEPKPAEALVLHFDVSLPVEKGVLIHDATQSIIIGHTLRTRERPNSPTGTSHDRELVVIAKRHIPVTVKRLGREPSTLVDRSRYYPGNYRQYVHPASQFLLGLTIGQVEVSFSRKTNEDESVTLELGVVGEIPMARKRITMDNPYLMKEQLDALESAVAAE